MKIIPTLYIQNGKVVSLYKGKENEQKKTYKKAAKSYATLFQSQGAKRIFIVDLDGDQAERLTEIRDSFDGELWWAGQVRSLESIQDLLERGADRIVLGASAQNIYDEALTTYGPEKLIIGFKITQREKGPDICEELSDSGFTDILIKDVNAEGTLFIPSFDLYEKCVYFSGLNVYSSGGVSDMDHLKLMSRSGVKGVMVSRAILEHQLSLEEALIHFPS